MTLALEIDQLRKSFGAVEALAGALSALAAMPDERVAGMGEAARQHVERDYSASVYRERMLAVYREVGLTCA